MLPIFVSPGRFEQGQIRKSRAFFGVQGGRKLASWARLLSPSTQPNQRPNQLKRQTSSVEMNSVAFCELSAAPVTGISPTEPLNGTLTPLPPYCE